MPLSDIVNVQITRQTQTVSQAGFGIPMILGTHKRFNDLIRYYSNMQGVAEDFSSSDPEYVAAQAIFSQAITPTQIGIGRRQADSVTIEVITPLTNTTFTVTINDIPYTINSTNTNSQSVITFSADFVANNLIQVFLNSTNVGTVTSVIDFDINFVSLNSIVATVNGVALTPVVFSVDQATTIALLATALQATTDILTATVTGVKQITCVFAAAGNNTVDSVVTTLGASQPVATISEGGFVFDTNQLTTMTNIQTAMEAEPGIASVSILPDGVNPNRKLSVASEPNMPGFVNTATVKLGASQASVNVSSTPQAVTIESIAAQLVESINATSVVVTATDNNDGTFVVDDVVTGFPYTLSVSTSLINANAGRVVIEQAIPSTAYSIRINGTDFSFTTNTDVQTNEAIAAEFVSLIGASTVAVVPTDNLDGSFELASSTPSQTFTCTILTPSLISYLKGMVVAPLVATDDITDSLDAIQAVNDDWYCLALTDRDSSTVQEAAAWIEAQVKIFGTASDDADIIDVPVGTDTTSIAAILNNLGYVRTFVIYHQDADSAFPECAWMGACLPFTPGSETWAFKRLSTVAYSDLSNNQENNAFNKECNTYEYIGGVGITQQGTMAQGEYIDIIRGVDWLTSTIQTYVYSVLVNSPKVPYTDAGITTIEAQIRRALNQGIANNFISDNPEPTVTVPRAADVSANDKANRLLTGVTFQATLAGAIQAVTINGTVTV